MNELQPSYLILFYFLISGREPHLQTSNFHLQKSHICGKMNQHQSCETKKKNKTENMKKMKKTTKTTKITMIKQEKKIVKTHEEKKT